MKQVLLHHFTQQRSDYNGPVMGYKKIAETYNVPAETFHRHLSGPHKGYYGYLAGGKDQSCMFTPEEEHELAKHIGKFAQASFPFTPKEIRELAFEYAHLNCIPGFNEMTKTAGYKWLRDFLKCNKQLTIKTPKLLSIYRAKWANKEVVSRWFELYKEVLEKNSIGGPLYIWNVDKCGCVDNPKAKKVVVIIRRRATQMSASEKGETSTALSFVSEAGMSTRPLVIHKGQKVQQAWKNDKPQSYSIGALENGWITKRLFYQYRIDYVQMLKNQGLMQDKNKKHLLLMDSHNSHTVRG